MTTWSKNEDDGEWTLSDDLGVPNSDGCPVGFIFEFDAPGKLVHYEASNASGVVIGTFPTLQDAKTAVETAVRGAKG